MKLRPLADKSDNEDSAPLMAPVTGAAHGGMEQWLDNNCKAAAAAAAAAAAEAEGFLWLAAAATAASSASAAAATTCGGGDRWLANASATIVGGGGKGDLVGNGGLLMGPWFQWKEVRFKLEKIATCNPGLELPFLVSRFSRCTVNVY